MRIRQPWLDTLEFMADLGLLDLPGKLRTHTGTPESGKKPKKIGGRSRCGCWVQAENRYIVQKFSNYPKDTALKQTSTPPVMQLPPAELRYADELTRLLGRAGQTASGRRGTIVATPVRIAERAGGLWLIQ